ncbi:MAG: methyltransferase domain-containing protein [Acidimicrobiales bacterium]
MNRLPSTTAALDDAERAWWHEHGDLEDRFCWVQPPEVQRILRGEYLERVVACVRPGDRVLEVGCGAGWLTLLLAELGSSEVTGIDFSSDQVALAKRAAKQAGASSVHFEVCALGEMAERDGGFDVVVMHAFLHHLATDEVDEAIRLAGSVLAPGGRLVVFEPTLFRRGRPTGPWALRALQRLIWIPMFLHRRGVRPVTPAEADVRQRLSERQRGVAPFGPAPKEIAFEEDELQPMLQRHVRVDARVRAVSMSLLVAQELLIGELSQPRAFRLVRRPVLLLARALDRWLLRAEPPPASVWVFELFIGTKAGCSGG